VFTPTEVTNWTAYVDKFGDSDNTKTLRVAVRGFFDNGGILATGACPERRGRL